MKRTLIFLTLAAGMILSACKKDKAPAPRPEYGGTPNAISGQWRLNVFTIDALIYEYGFGTNLRYEKEAGKPGSAIKEKGTYTLTPVAGSATDYTVALTPENAAPYTLTIHDLTASEAIFDKSAPNEWSFGFIRK